MKFSTKLRRYIEDNHVVKSRFAILIGVSPAMINKYLYYGSMPCYKIAKQINIATDNIITMEDMECA